jgi:hypothetical protein
MYDTCHRAAACRNPPITRRREHGHAGERFPGGKQLGPCRTRRKEPSMNTPINTSHRRHLVPALRWLAAAALAIGATGAYASSGFTVSAKEEMLVKAGMSQQDIRQALGQPAIVHTYSRAPGPTWTYNLTPDWHHAVVDIDFGADGKVASVSEREMLVE